MWMGSASLLGLAPALLITVWLSFPPQKPNTISEASSQIPSMRCLWQLGKESGPVSQSMTRSSQVRPLQGKNIFRCGQRCQTQIQKIKTLLQPQVLQLKQAPWELFWCRLRRSNYGYSQTVAGFLLLDLVLTPLGVECTGISFSLRISDFQPVGLDPKVGLRQLVKKKKKRPFLFWFFFLLQYRDVPSAHVEHNWVSSRESSCFAL